LGVQVRICSKLRKRFLRVVKNNKFFIKRELIPKGESFRPLGIPNVDKDGMFSIHQVSLAMISDIIPEYQQGYQPKGVVTC